MNATQKQKRKAKAAGGYITCPQHKGAFLRANEYYAQSERGICADFVQKIPIGKRSKRQECLVCTRVQNCADFVQTLCKNAVFRAFLQHKLVILTTG